MAESMSTGRQLKERRSSPRVHANIKVYIPGRNMRRFTSANLSASGLFLRTQSREFRLNQVFTIVITLEKGPVTRVFWRIAKVVRIHPDGYGLRIWRDRALRQPVA